MADRATTTFQAGADKYRVTTYAPSGAAGKLPAVVLLHGWPGTRADFRKALAAAVER